MRRALALAAFAAAALAASGPRAQDAADLVVRLNRVEGQMRQLSGQVEQLGYENRQLKEQLRKFQEDTEFRFGERGGKPGAPPASGPAGSKPARRSDAFDPDADPAAPGAPRPLGSAGSAAPPAGRPVAVERGPVETSPARPPRTVTPGPGAIPDDDEDDDGPPAGQRPLDLGATGRSGPPAGSAGLAPPRVTSPVQEPGRQEFGRPEPGRPPSMAATGSQDPRADYDVAYAFLIQRQYERAEMGFRSFLQSHPRDRLVPDAIYWLGESYLQRNRPREAAEQFLKVSTEHARAAKAPDALLKLGVALSALGARDQACATFAELERKYPAASGSLKQGVDREQKRARCAT